MSQDQTGAEDTVTVVLLGPDGKVKKEIKP